MIVVVILFVSTLVFRGLGLAGVSLFDTWQASARFGLAVMLLFTAAAHFTSVKEDLVRMMPGWVPVPLTVVYFTGICEIAGAIGLMLPRFQRAAGLALIIFFLAILPANIHAARAGVTLRGQPVTALWLRIPVQAFFIFLAWWTTGLNSRS